MIRIGSLTLSTPLCLAPMAGYTNLAFRLLLRPLGGLGLCTSELVNARSLLEKHRKAFELIRTCPQDRPLAVQLYGARPEELRDAAVWLQEHGYDAVDINMGCPVRKVCRSGSGAALLADSKKARQLAEAVVEAVQIPVTCKLRLGPNDRHITAPDLARALEDAGVAAITVHGRTRQQGFGGTVNLAGIRAVVQAVRIPVMGNGDVLTPPDAKRMLDETGCAGVAIARGAFYNPWIFRDTAQFLATGLSPTQPTFEDRVAFMTAHLDRMIELYGEEHACRQFRKIALAYIKPFGPVMEFRRRIVRLQSRAEFDEILTAYRRWREAKLKFATDVASPG
ncbi:MAG: tRNA dihydrouridine synthase DusB [Verrucomicrobiae bacterium]|nr:tRNA dihydrouridine synthase DusB [Verrucomicrobiae bacterium]